MQLEPHTMLEAPHLIPPEVPLFASVADDKFARFRAMESVGVMPFRAQSKFVMSIDVIAPDPDVRGLRPVRIPKSTETFFVYSSQEFPKITARSRRARHLGRRWLALFAKYKSTNPRRSERYFRKMKEAMRECCAIERQTVRRTVVHRIEAEVDSEPWRVLSFAARGHSQPYFQIDGFNPWSPRWRGTVVTSKDFKAATIKRDVVGWCDLADRWQANEAPRKDNPLADRLRMLIPEARVDRVSPDDIVRLNERNALWVDGEQCFAAIVVDGNQYCVDVIKLPWLLPLSNGVSPIIGIRGRYWEETIRPEHYTVSGEVFRRHRFSGVNSERLLMTIDAFVREPHNDEDVSLICAALWYASREANRRIAEGEIPATRFAVIKAQEAIENDAAFQESVRKPPCVT